MTKFQPIPAEPGRIWPPEHVWMDEDGTWWEAPGKRWEMPADSIIVHNCTFDNNERQGIVLGASVPKKQTE